MCKSDKMLKFNVLCGSLFCNTILVNFDINHHISIVLYNTIQTIVAI